MENQEIGPSMAMETDIEIMPAHQEFINKRHAAIREKLAEWPGLANRLIDILEGRRDEVTNELNELNFGSDK